MRKFEYESEHVTAYYDTDTHVIWIIYKGALSPLVTSEAYHHLRTVIVPAITGTGPSCIFDFTQVTDFQFGNIQAARKETRTMSENPNVSNTPVALIVKNALQEGMVKINLKLNPNPDRLRLVASAEEAMLFFKEWREAKEAEKAVEKPKDESLST